MPFSRFTSHSRHAIAGRRHSVSGCSEHDGLVRCDGDPHGEAVWSTLAAKPYATRRMFLDGPKFRWCPSRSPQSRPRSEMSLCSKSLKKNGSSGRIRTYNPPVNSRMLCH